MFQLCIELTNRKWSSFLIKHFAKSKVSRLLIPTFIKTFQLNMDESFYDKKEFKSLHALFTRPLKTDVRPVAAGQNIVVSPVDGVCKERGIIEEGATFKVKGQLYSLSDMLGSEHEGRKYEEGYYVIFYLSPRDYHRIHSPFECIVKESKLLGNRSYPVNQLGLLYGKQPLSLNYRQVNYLYRNNNVTAMIEVGAMNINTIVRTKKEADWDKAEEVGHFSFGSTVILLFEKKFISSYTYAVRGENGRRNWPLYFIKKRLANSQVFIHFLPEKIFHCRNKASSHLLQSSYPLELQYDKLTGR